MSQLSEAIEAGDLAQVKREFTRDSSELDTEDYWKLRPIDVAACGKYLKILDYLLAQGACLKTNAKKPSLLYWLINEIADKSKPKIVCWIRTNQKKLLAADFSLSKEHLKAILGENADWDSPLVHGGLLPFHYGALMDNPHARGWMAKWVNQPLPSNDWFSSYSFPLLLATNKKFNLLSELNRKNVFIDLNIASQNPQDQEYEETLACRLAEFDRWQLLEALAEKNNVVNLNAQKRLPESSRKKTLAWFLLINKQFELFEKLAFKSPGIDLDCGSPQLTVAFFLVESKRWGLLEALAPKSDIINLNAGKKGESTVASLLIIDQQEKLVRRLMHKSPPIDLRAKCEVSKNDEAKETKSLLELLLDLEQWELIETIIELPENVTIQETQEREKYLHGLLGQIRNPTLDHLIIYLQLKRFEREISLIIEKGNDEVQPPSLNKQAVLLESFLSSYQRLFTQIPVDSIYYKKAAYSKAHLFIQFTAHFIIDLHLDKLLQAFPLAHCFQPIEGKLNQLWFLCMEAAYDAKDKPLILQLAASQITKNSNLGVGLAEGRKNNFESVCYTEAQRTFTTSSENKALQRKDSIYETPGSHFFSMRNSENNPYDRRQKKNIRSLSLSA